MRRYRRAYGALAGAGLMVASLAAVSGPASAAAPLPCGTVITKSRTLPASMTCPTGTALTIKGSRVTLKLGGFSVIGAMVSHTVNEPANTANPAYTYTVRYTTNNNPGIKVDGTSNSIVGPGKVQHFAAGIHVLGGSKNTISGVTVDENVGPAGTSYFGDGIIIENSTHNVIKENTIKNNGPFSGMTLLGAAKFNDVQGNTFKDNDPGNLCKPTGTNLYCGNQTNVNTRRVANAITFSQNFGFRIEGDGPNGEGATDNIINGNLITGSGNDGMFVGSYCNPGNCFTAAEGNHNNTISGNTFNGNGFGYRELINGVATLIGRPGSSMFGGTDDGGRGLFFFTVGPNPPGTTKVLSNVANGNARHGIDVGNSRAYTRGHTSDSGGCFGSGTSWTCPIGKDGGNNLIRGNTASNNNAAPTPDPCPNTTTNRDCSASYNLVDSDGIGTNPDAPPCGTNTWDGNKSGPIVSYDPNLAGDGAINQECVMGHMNPQAFDNVPKSDLSPNSLRRYNANDIDGEEL